MAPAPAPAELLARGRDTAVVVGEYALETAWAVTHPEWRRSGATPAEEAEALPGDDLVPEPNWAATRAETIPAAPERVWPWLAQMGYGRGGWYGDFPWWGDPAGHRGRRSAADRILAEHQRLGVGDVLLDGRNCSPEVGAWYVRALDPGHHLVLFSSRTLAGREVAFLPSRPRSYFDCSWSFVLRPTPDGGSRVLVRSRVRYHPAWVLRVVSVVRAGDTVMQRAMLSGIRRRAAGPSGDETGSAVPGPARPPARATLPSRRTRFEHAVDTRSAGLGVWLLRRTRGRLAGLWGRRALVLITRGRKTGRTREVPLQYFPDGDSMVVVAANSGMPRAPGWFHNLVADPRAVVDVGGRRLRVRAHVLTPEEAAAFWPRVLDAAPDYARYPERTSRAIPLVRLVPDSPRAVNFSGREPGSSAATGR